jgi:hypothetical protein
VDVKKLVRRHGPYKLKMELGLKLPLEPLQTLIKRSHENKPEV